MQRRTKIMIALAIVVGNVASFLLIFDPGTDFYVPPPREIAAPYQAPKVPPIEFPFEKFDTITATFHCCDSVAYPVYPYTLEISGDGKIKFTNAVIPNGSKGEISAGQVAALLKSLNDNNVEFIAKLPSLERMTCQASHILYAEITVVIDKIQKSPITGCSYRFPELSNFIHAVQKAGEEFVATSFLKAATAGNLEAQCILANHYYTPSAIAQPWQNFSDAYFWTLIAQKSLGTGKKEVLCYVSKDEATIHKKYESILTPKEVAKVKKRVEEWKPTP